MEAPGQKRLAATRLEEWIVVVLTKERVKAALGRVRLTTALTPTCLTEAIAWE